MKNLLREAAFEIRELRKQNQLLRARTDVLDLFAHVLRIRYERGVSPDVVYGLDMAIKELEAKETLKESGLVERPGVQLTGRGEEVSDTTPKTTRGTRVVPRRNGGGRRKSKVRGLKSKDEGGAVERALAGGTPALPSKPTTVAGAMKAEIAGFKGREFTSADLEAALEAKYGNEDFWKEKSRAGLSANLSYWASKDKLSKTAEGYKVADVEFFSRVEFAK